MMEHCHGNNSFKYSKKFDLIDGSFNMNPKTSYALCFFYIRQWSPGFLLLPLGVLVNFKISTIVPNVFEIPCKSYSCLPVLLNCKIHCPLQLVTRFTNLY